MSQRLSFAGHIRAILVLGLPLVGGHLMQFLIGLTDTVMIGWYGVEELAALTLGNTMFFTFFLFGSGIAWAVMPMVARFVAQDDQTSIRRATRMGLWLSMIFAGLVMPVFVFAEPVLLLLGQGDAVAEGAALYLAIAGWGMIPALGTMVLKSYLAALEHTRVVFVITALAAALNILFNYALIFGNFGLPEMGIAGAALASTLTHGVGCLGAMIYAVRKLPEHALFQRFWRPDRGMMAEVFRLGWPIGLTSLAEVALFAISTLLIGRLGTVPLAAHGIALQLSAAAFMVQVGLSNAATVRAGNAAGRGDPAHLAAGARAVLWLSVSSALMAAAVFVLVPVPLIGLFLSPTDPARAEIIAIGVSLLGMAALFQLVDGAQVVALGLLRGLQDTQVPMIMAGIAYLGIGFPAAWLLGFPYGFGGVGVWAGLVLGLTAAGGMLIWRFWRQALPALESGEVLAR
ncbi:MATE family efflux transporter [Litorisediminicola beolgyonensis]|uniref:Multidrug-efflux transporter n=1 Tax=Litorisediminicola beolgyonensis TaxID=1173614 RepID=A0ABW3ZKN0_9RHOB